MDTYLKGGPFSIVYKRLFAYKLVFFIHRLVPQNQIVLWGNIFLKSSFAYE
jgi:hypothetical protein